MAQPSYIFKNDALARHQKAYIDLVYIVTGAKAGKFATLPPRALLAYDNGSAPSQADVDALLGSSSEFAVGTVYGSTALGTDALAFILDCEQQIASAAAIEVKAVLGTTQSDQVGAPLALANTLPDNPRVQVSSLGNIGVQLVISGLDAATSGLVLIRIHCDLK